MPELDRKLAVPALVGRHQDYLIVGGLGGPSKDLSALIGDGPNLFSMSGAMGAATPIGLGLALARPRRRVLVVTGEGELLMNVGALATVALAAPDNLAILVVDNEVYGETGNQQSHTGRGTDLAAMAAGAGVARVSTVRSEAEIPAAAAELRDAQGPVFVVVKVSAADPPAAPRDMDAAACRTRFRAALDREAEE